MEPERFGFPGQLHYLVVQDDGLNIVDERTGERSVINHPQVLRDLRYALRKWQEDNA